MNQHALARRRRAARKLLALALKMRQISPHRGLTKIIHESDREVLREVESIALSVERRAYRMAGGNVAPRAYKRTPVVA